MNFYILQNDFVFEATYPQDAVACNGVHPSLSCLFTSAPCCTKNSTISKLSSMHAYLKERKTKHITQSHWEKLYGTTDSHQMVSDQIK